jgi:hypothetical protein
MLTALLAAALLTSGPARAAPAAPALHALHALHAAPDSTLAEARIQGRVVDDVLDRPLARAVVWLSGASVHRTITTGPDGAFAFPDLAAGSYLLRVQREAYDSASVSVVVPPGRKIVVDVQLTRRPELLRPVVVHAPPDQRDAYAGHDGDVASREPGDGAARALRALDMRSRAGSMLAGALGGSGPRRPPDPGGGDGHTLFVWGSEDESGQVLLDGAVIGAPLHLGGLLPSVDPELVNHARLRTGGAPARFDGGTGYVLELSTREPSPGSLRMWGESNLVSDRVGGEAPLGESGSILAGARRVRTEMLPRLSGVMRGYLYDDLLARGTLRTGDRGELRATFFGTDEALRIPRDQGSDEASWWNRAGSLAWESEGAGERSAVRLSMARAVTDLPLLSAYGGHLYGDVNRATMAASRRWDTDRSRWGVGGELEYARCGREARGSSTGAPASDSSSIIDANGGSCDGAAACAHASSATAAVYGDVRHRLSDRLWLDAGLRIATTPRDHTTPLVDALPRLALEAYLTPRTSLRLAAGRYSRLGAFFSADAGSTVQTPGGGSTLPAMIGVQLVRDHADQLELSATQRWGPTALAVATYLHRREGNPARTHLDHAVGLDASFSYSGSWISAAASYTRITRSYDLVAAPSGLPPLNGGTRPGFGVEQLISLDGTVRAGRLALALSGSYARGIPYTSIVLDRPADGYAGSPTSLEGSVHDFDDYDAALARSYLRLDATLSGRWCIGGRECPVRLSPYVRVINALDRRDALFYYQDGDLDDPRSLAALPAVLSIGVKWELARAPR